MGKPEQTAPEAAGDPFQYDFRFSNWGSDSDIVESRLCGKVEVFYTGAGRFLATSLDRDVEREGRGSTFGAAIADLVARRFESDARTGLKVGGT